MKSKKIYLIRHGQTDYNLRGIVQGSGIDAPLNATGRSQSFDFYKAYNHISFQKIYTSTLIRTYQSVEKFITKGIKHESLVGLDEISWGNREGVPITPAEDAYYHRVITEWQQGNTSLPIEGGESPEMVQKRQKEAIKKIISDNESPILICMHGRAMRILLCTLLKYPLRFMDEFEHTNLCLYELNYTGSMFNISKHNDVKHLISSY